MEWSFKGSIADQRIHLFLKKRGAELQTHVQNASGVCYGAYWYLNNQGGKKPE